MANFHYKAFTQKGAVKEGSEPAGSYGEMLSRLRERDYYPVSIEEIVEKDIKELPIFKRVSIKQIALFCRQFATMLNAGVTIIKCLDIIRQQVTNTHLKDALGDVFEDVQKGLVLSEAMGKRQDIFPELLCHMVQVGEESGNLDKIMLRIALQYEKDAKINSRVKSAMVYPAILGTASVLVVIFLLTFVMPTFVGMFASSGASIPGLTSFLISVSDVFRNYWYVFFAAIAAIVYFFKKFKSSPSGRHSIDELKLRIPVYKNLTKKVISVRFTRTMSTMLSSGIPLIQALDRVSRAVGNTVVETSLLEAKEDIKKGAAMSSTIRKTKLFPSMVPSMIEIGEESGTLDEILDKSANIYDEEVETEVQRLIALIDPAMIFIMAGLIGFIVIAMMLPMFDMINTVS